jgi:tRNA threonylcarbamoyladenosine biosynthesis protein TsaE
MRELSFLYTLDEIDRAAVQIIRYAGDVKIWLFTGDMGTGKTTLIKSICHVLGAEGDFSSPTYSLANEYQLSDNKGKIFHLDLYRLRSIEEALDIGIEDYLFDGSYCLIEWPQLIIPLLKNDAVMTVNITTVSENERKISIFI